MREKNYNIPCISRRASSIQTFANLCEEPSWANASATKFEASETKSIVNQRNCVMKSRISSNHISSNVAPKVIACAFLRKEILITYNVETFVQSFNIDNYFLKKIIK